MDGKEKRGLNWFEGRCGDKPGMFIWAKVGNLIRTAISGGKRPNPSDLGS